MFGHLPVILIATSAFTLTEDFISDIIQVNSFDTSYLLPVRRLSPNGSKPLHSIKEI